MRLENLIDGRENNLNLIRMLAAFAVLVTHSFALAIGTGDAEPLRAQLGMTMGSISVDIFFIASGFLVTSSITKSRSVVDFAWARILRIYPGLLVMLLLTVFALCLALSSRAWNEYLTDRKTYSYFARCASLFFGVNYELPGVFENNPYPRAVNGSLWTMPLEVRMYALLALTWVITSRQRGSPNGAFKGATILFAVTSGVAIMLLHLLGRRIDDALWLFFMFFTGSAYFQLRHLVRLSLRTFLSLFIATLAAAIFGPRVFLVMYALAIAYMTIYLAYVPAGVIRRYNRIGDYSYGIYIYAFPVQQTVVMFFPGISVFDTLAVSMVTTLALSALSWHCIEKKAITMKHLFIAYSGRLIART